MTEDGYYKMLRANGQVVAQPARLSYQDMTVSPYNIRQYGESAATFTVPPDDYRPNMYEQKKWGMI